MPETDNEFITHLHNEKLKTQEVRTFFIKNKLRFIITFLGLGSINFPDKFSMNILFYLIPFIAIGFDLFIAGEDYSIKRIGAFLKTNSPSEKEKEWEEFVKNHRDYLSIFSNILFSAVIIIICSQAVNDPNKGLLNELNNYVFLSSLTITVVIWLFALVSRYWLNKGTNAWGSMREKMKKLQQKLKRKSKKEQKQESKQKSKRGSLRYSFGVLTERIKKFLKRKPAGSGKKRKKIVTIQRIQA